MIYLLKRIGETWYDEYDAKIVRARSEGSAREIADKEPGDEGKIWTDPELVSCEKITPSGESAQLLGSFNAG